MTYDVRFEMTDGRVVENDIVTGAESPVEVEYEIARGDEYVVSNSRKHVRVKSSDVRALIIELKEG